MQIRKFIHKLNIIIGIFLLLSCNNSMIFSDLIGDYYNIDSVDYIYLKLRRDSTFVLIQSPLYGDAMFYNYGYFKVENNYLELFTGKDFSKNLELDTIVDYRSDTLNISFSEDISDRFPNLKISINDDKDLAINKNQYIIEKPIYWKLNNELYNSNDSYQYVPIYLLLRSGEFYATIEYVFENKQLSISLNEEEILNSENELLIKYILRESILISKNESSELLKNRLRKE